MNLNGSRSPNIVWQIHIHMRQSIKKTPYFHKFCFF